jgi:hypothetical protein
MANVPVTISRAIVVREGATPSSPPSFEDDPDPINQPGSGGDGVNNFIELNDTPASYTGEAGKVVAVKSGEDGLEFTTISLANTHNDLGGLQGGATGQYYHLTEDEYDAVLNAATTPDATNPFVTAADLGAAGLGTVTSVGLTAPDIFSISGSPVTSAGTLGLTFTSQSEFTVLARGSGAGVPSFQALVAGHIPNLAISKITNLQSSLDAKLSNALTSTQIFVGNSSNVATGRALTLNASGGTFGLSNTGVLTFPNASTSLRGLLTSADWNTFNGKQDALGFTPENVANKSTNTALGTSNVLYPTQNAVKVYVDTGLGTKQNTITGAATTITSSNLTTNRALISNASGKVAVSEIMSTELGHLSGVTSAIQTQLNGKEPSFIKNTAFNKNFGTIAGTVAEGNDSRINNGQTAFGWGNHATQGYAVSGTGGTQVRNNTQLDGRYVLKAGDTMTGPLTFTTAGEIFGGSYADLNSVQAGSSAIKPFRSGFQASNRPPNSNWAAGIEINPITDSGNRFSGQIAMQSSFSTANALQFRMITGSGNVFSPWYSMWHAGNLDPSIYAVSGTGGTQVRNNTQLDAQYVLKIGDTMTGQLVFNKTLSSGNQILDFQQSYGLFSDNAGAGGDNTRLWLDAPNNGELVLGPRSGANFLGNMRLRSNQISFERSGGTTMFLNASGNVLIGTTSEVAFSGTNGIIVQRPNAAISLSSGASATASWLMYRADSNASLRWYNGSDRMLLSSLGTLTVTGNVACEDPTLNRHAVTLGYLNNFSFFIDKGVSTTPGFFTPTLLNNGTTPFNIFRNTVYNWLGSNYAIRRVIEIELSGDLDLPTNSSHTWSLNIGGINYIETNLVRSVGSIGITGSFWNVKYTITISSTSEIKVTGLLISGNTAVAVTTNLDINFSSNRDIFIQGVFSTNSSTNKIRSNQIFVRILS